MLACKNSRINTLFLDNCKVLTRERNKYWKRASWHTLHGGSCVLSNFAMVLGSLFKIHGANICYSKSIDNDETLAAFAIHHKSSALSADKDFLQFYSEIPIGRKRFIPRVFSEFSISNALSKPTLVLDAVQSCLKSDLWGDERNHSYGAFDLYKEDRKYVEKLKIKYGAAFPYRKPLQLIDSLPSTTPSRSPTAKLIAERDEEGIPIIRLANKKPYPFAFQCDAKFDSMVQFLPLRLAMYGLLGEHIVVEQDLVWRRSTESVLSLTARSCKWVQSQDLSWNCFNISNFQNVSSTVMTPRPTLSVKDQQYVLDLLTLLKLLSVLIATTDPSILLLDIIYTSLLKNLRHAFLL